MYLQQFSIRVARFSTRSPRRILAVHLLLLMLAVAGVAQHLSTASRGATPLLPGFTNVGNVLFDNSIQAIIGYDSPEIQRYTQFQKNFGSEEFVEFVVSVPAPVDARVFNHLAAYAGAVESLEYGLEVFWAGRLPHAPEALKLNRDVDPAELAGFLDRMHDDPLAGRLISEGVDRSALALLIVTPPQGRNDLARARLVEAIQRLWEESGPPGDWTAVTVGVPTIMSALRQAVVDSLTINFPLINGIIILILLLTLRRVRIVVLVLVALLQSELLVIGLFIATGHAFNYITANIAAIIMVIGIAANIHVATRYSKERRQMRAIKAIEAAFATVGRPSLMATITTTVALLSLTYAREAAVQEFGLFSALGLLAVLFSTFTLFPALAVLFDRREPGPWLPAPRTPTLVHIPRWAWNHAPVVLVATVGLSLATVAGIGALKLGTNIQNYFHKGSPIRQSSAFVSQFFPGFVPFEVSVTWRGDTMKPELLLATLSELKQKTVDYAPAAGIELHADQVTTFSDLAASFCLNPAKAGLCEQGRPKPEVVEALVRAGAALGAVALVRRYADGYTARMTVYQDPPYAAAGYRLVRYLRDVAAEVAGPQADVDVTGMAALWAIKDTSITRELIRSFLIAGIIIFIAMAAIYRSRRVFAISLLPNIVPLLVVLGVTGYIGAWQDMHISSPALMFTTIAIGIVVDSTLFFLLTYQDRIRMGLSGTQALHDTMHNVGSGIILTSACLTLGFGTLLFGALAPMRQLGALLSVTVFLALLADLLILPALCRFFWNPAAKTPA